MNIYFFSDHTPDPKMIQDLGQPITTRFKGCISDITARGNQISFTETLRMAGDTLKVCHIVPAESIVITECSLVLQAAWLKARVATLLVPQITQEFKNWGYHTAKYSRLVQVHRVEVVTSDWVQQQSEKTENSLI